MAYTTGQEIYLSSASLYVDSTTATVSNTVTGTYYIWSGSEVNSRIRITTSEDYCGKSAYVTGWINTSSISGSSSSSSSSSTDSSTTSSSSSTSSVVTETKTETKVEPDSDVPGQIGFLGVVVFLVSSSQIKTINDFTWSSSATYAAHARHTKAATVEFTGVEPDEISFSFLLSSYLGTDPMYDYVTLLGYMRTGTAIPLNIGGKYYGRDRWLITSLEYKGDYSDKEGAWTQAEVSVSLVGYERYFANDTMAEYNWGDR